jgi:hypothetical protein
MKTDKLVSYLKTTEGIAVRACGFLALAKNDCSHCSVYSDNIEPAQKDMGDVVDRIDQLNTMLEKGE